MKKNITEMFGMSILKDVEKLWVCHSKLQEKLLNPMLCFNIPAEVRYRLLGHQDRTIKSHYQNWEWEKMIDKVDEAHIKVLEEFKVEKIWNSLRKRGRELGLSEYVVNKDNDRVKLS